jgi:hypothetical protein
MARSPPPDEVEMEMRGGGPPPGIGIDTHGERVIDPTKNVEDLFRAGRDADKELRLLNDKFVDMQFSHVTKTWEMMEKRWEVARTADRDLATAETRRIDQLAQTRQEFQNTIRDMLAESVRTTSTLVSTQLVQIQATFDTRVSKLEAGAFTQAGKSSVADPQLADFMRLMAQSIQSMSSASADTATKLTAQQAESTAKLTLAIAALGARESTGEGRRLGQGQIIAWIVAAVGMVAAVAGPIIAVMSMRGR